ncbi:MAG: hypothetical protein PF545_07950 [Elusimicrobia bacterium]|jgi:hypothetical protein|nr:hypothetical protein [Elusimicrobiota bacterium]
MKIIKDKAIKYTIFMSAENIYFPATIPIITAAAGSRRGTGLLFIVIYNAI